jgi:protein gp37
MNKTKIEWTDYSWPIINGCRRKSAGCESCYAERLAATRLAQTEKYKGLAVMTPNGPRWTGETRLWEPALQEPLRLKKPSRIFVADMGDLFYEGVNDEDIDKVFAVMALCPQHTFQVLTKRAERMRDYFCNREGWIRLTTKLFETVSERGLDEMLLLDCTFEDNERSIVRVPLKNVWLGVSCEDQKTADERIPWLLRTPAAVRWVSYEPALGPVNFVGIRDANTRVTRGAYLGPCLHADDVGGLYETLGLDWIVCGGESGPGARPMHPDWARSARDQCVAVGVPFFFKQHGAWMETDAVPGGDLGGDMRRDIVRIVKPCGEPDGHFRRGDALMRRVGKHAAGRLLDGREWNEYPNL